MGTQPADSVSDPFNPSGPITSDHPGVLDLFAVLAFGEISAFYELVEDAGRAPTLRDRAALASMAAAEMAHFETLQQAIAARGADVFEVIAPFAAALESYHASTSPSTWTESLVKAYIGDGIAADFYGEVAAAMPADVAAVIHSVLAGTGHSEFVVEQVRAAVAANPQEGARLALWGRRLFGEAITQAQFVLAQRDALMELVLAASGDLNHLVVMFDRMQAKHEGRMSTLGLGGGVDLASL